MTVYCGSLLHKDKDTVMCLLKQVISAVKGSSSYRRIVKFFVCLNSALGTSVNYMKVVSYKTLSG